MLTMYKTCCKLNVTMEGVFMKFCSDCGANLPDGAMFCFSCGTPVQPDVNQPAPEQPAYVTVDPVQPQYPQYPEAQPAGTDDDPYPINVTHRGFWWLGFIVPVLGLILHIVWKNQKPRLSRSIGKGALVGAIVQGVCYTVYLVFCFALGFFSEMLYYI